MRGTLAWRCAAELLGTALLVGVGTGANVAGADVRGAPIWILALAWFVAVALPILLFAPVSGAHLNPAVTVALAIGRRFSTMEVLPYIGAQVAGAFVGSGSVALLLGTGDHLGATTPRGGDVLLVFPLEAIFTAALILSVLLVASSRTRPSPIELLSPAGVVGVSTLLIGPWTGSSLNPARSLAPAILSGDVRDLWAYLLVVPLTSVIVSLGVRRPHRRISAPERDDPRG